MRITIDFILEITTMSKNNDGFLNICIQDKRTISPTENQIMFAYEYADLPLIKNRN